MKINIKCNFCGTTYDEQSCNGICPSCGARNEKKVKLVKKSSIEIKNENIKQERIETKKDIVKTIKTSLIVFIFVSSVLPIISMAVIMQIH